MALRSRSPSRARRSGLWQHWTVWIYFPLALLLCVFGACLWKSGKWLVHDDPVDKVSWAVVLAGESRDCERTEAAIKLYLDARVDTIVISSERILKNRYPSQFLVNDYAREGVPRGKVFEFHHDAYSTLEEARLLIRQFRLQNLDTVLIITSNYHTARARRIFRKLSAGLPHILVHSAEYHAYDPSSWWSSRESREIWFTEWMKTVYGWWELLGMPAESGKAEYQNLIPDVWGPSLGRPAASAEDTLPEPPPPDTAKGQTPPRGDALEADSARDTVSAVIPPADSASAPADTSKAAAPSPAPADTAARAPEEKESAKDKAAKEAREEKPKAAAKPAQKPAKDSAKKPDKKAEKPKKKSG